MPGLTPGRFLRIRRGLHERIPDLRAAAQARVRRSVERRRPRRGVRVNSQIGLIISLLSESLFVPFINFSLLI